jgi:RNA polymerase sigma-70 factor (family 1)
LFTEKEIRLRGIIHRTNAKLYGFLFSICGDRHWCADIIQQVYIKLWENLDEIDNDEKILPLLKLYSRNIFLNELKRQGIRQKAYMAAGGEELDISVEEQLLNKEQQQHIQTAISKLPPQQQQIFRMHKEQALSYRQISEQLNISTGTIETQMNRALKFLRSELGNMRSEEYAVTLLIMYCTIS